MSTRGGTGILRVDTGSAHVALSNSWYGPELQLDAHMTLARGALGKLERSPDIGDCSELPVAPGIRPEYHECANG